MAEESDRIKRIKREFKERVKREPVKVPDPAQKVSRHPTSKSCLFCRRSTVWLYLPLRVNICEACGARETAEGWQAGEQPPPSHEGKTDEGGTMMDMRKLVVGQRVTLPDALPGTISRSVVTEVTKWYVAVQVWARIDGVNGFYLNTLQFRWQRRQTV